MDLSDVISLTVKLASSSQIQVYITQVCWTIKFFGPKEQELVSCHGERGRERTQRKEAGVGGKMSGLLQKSPAPGLESPGLGAGYTR